MAFYLIKEQRDITNKEWILILQIQVSSLAIHMYQQYQPILKQVSDTYYYLHTHTSGP